MQLIQAKIRGTGATLATTWFKIHRRTTCIYIAEATARTRFLHGLHAINPATPAADPDLFSNVPRVIRTDGHLRKIIPHKRTVAMGIFAATPELVMQLGQLWGDLYETDRIEVGRRLDRSRWMNFVEISSSTRWGEIAEAMQPVLASPEAAASRYKFLADLAATDRVKGKIHDELLNLLDAFSAARPDSAEPIAQLRENIRRVDSFAEARKTVYRKLPRTYLLTMASTTHAEKIEAEAHKACRQAKEDGHAPIFLIDSPEHLMPPGENDRLGGLIQQISDLGQLIIVTGDNGLFTLTPDQVNHTQDQLATDVRQEEMV